MPRKVLIQGGVEDFKLDELSDSDLPSVNTNKNALNTGILLGGALSVNASDNTTFDVEAGVGLVVDHATSPPTVTSVSWDAFTGVTVDNLATDTSTDVAIDINGAIVQQKSFTNSELRSLIFLGGIDHSGSTVINNTFSVQIPSFDPGLAIRDLADAVGDINISGNGIFANGVDMRIKKTTGNTFSFGRNTTNDITDPHIISTPEQAPVSFRYIFSDGAGGTSVGSETELIDPTVYDDGSGTLQTTSNNHWVAQRVLFFPNSENIFIQHSQAEYNKKADALDAISFSAFDELQGFGTAVTLAIIIVKKEATDLSDSTTTQFVDVGKFGDVTSIGVQEVVWGDIGGTLSNQTDLQTALDGKSDTGHTHTLTDITDSGTAAAADTGTGSSNVPTVADLLAGNWTFENVLNISGTGNKLQEIRSTNDGAVQLRLRTDNDNNRRLLGLAQDGSVLTQIIFRDDVVELAGTSNSTDLFCSIGRDGATFQDQVFHDFEALEHTAISSLPDTLTIDSDRHIQTVEVTGGTPQALTLTIADENDGLSRELVLYVYNSSGASLALDYSAIYPTDSENVGDGSTRIIVMHYDGRRGYIKSSIEALGDRRP